MQGALFRPIASPPPLWGGLPFSPFAPTSPFALSSRPGPRVALTRPSFTPNPTSHSQPLASLCAFPLPRPKALRCVPLSLRPRAVAFCASFASPLRVLTRPSALACGPCAQSICASHAFQPPPPVAAIDCARLLLRTQKCSAASSCLRPYRRLAASSSRRFLIMRAPPRCVARELHKSLPTLLLTLHTPTFHPYRLAI